MSCLRRATLSGRSAEAVKARSVLLIQNRLERSANLSAELCYNFKYMEKNDHGHGQGWSERQIGVYHRFGGNVKAVMVLLHANTATKAHSRLQQVFSDGQYQQQSSTSPLLLHALILSSYLDNWRPNLQQLGAWCLSKVSREPLTLWRLHKRGADLPPGEPVPDCWAETSISLFPRAPGAQRSRIQATAGVRNTTLVSGRSPGH